MNDSELWALREKFADLTAAIRESLSVMARQSLAWQGEFNGLDANDRAILKFLQQINEAVALGKTLEDLPARLALRMLTSVSAEQLASQVPADTINAARKLQYEAMKRDGLPLPLGPAPGSTGSFPAYPFGIEPAEKERPENSSPSLTIDSKRVRFSGSLKWKDVKKNWHIITMAFGSLGLAVHYAMTMWPK